VNAARRAHPALQTNERLEFRHVDNDMLVAYTKHTEDRGDVVLCIVNLDPHHTQSGWIDLPLEHLGIDPDGPYQVHDLLADETYTWQGGHNYVELDPHRSSAHVFHIRRRLRTEHDFEYYA
jgi:starch synthase (maltosyl-transferring)